jgi:polysaccharide export outer membrane protein
MRRHGNLAGVGARLAVVVASLALAAPLAVGAGDANQVAVCGPSTGNQISEYIGADGADPQADYVIGPQDHISIHVFDVKDLSTDDEVVDTNGQIEMPLIGRVTAAGKTTQQLQDEIAQRLGDRYLQSPKVAVLVMDSASQKVTVEGEVKNPGVFQMKGRTTLMQAIAMAGGPATNADLHKVAVIREDHGFRKAAVCDYENIRQGRQIDPSLHGDDIVVVDGSRAKQFWSVAVQTLPLFTIFAYLR